MGSFWYVLQRVRRATVDLPIWKFGHHHDGAEGLLFGDEHVVLHVSEHGGLHEET